MLFVLPGILFIGLMIIGIWTLFFRKTLQQERSVKEAHQRAEDIERWLSVPGEPLYCASCDEAFRGPLQESGCPRCHTQTLVIPVRISSDSHVHALADRLPRASMEALSQETVSRVEETSTREGEAPPVTAVLERKSSVAEPLSQRKRGI